MYTNSETFKYKYGRVFVFKKRSSSAGKTNDNVDLMRLEDEKKKCRSKIMVYKLGGDLSKSY